MILLGVATENIVTGQTVVFDPTTGKVRIATLDDTMEYRREHLKKNPESAIDKTYIPESDHE